MGFNFSFRGIDAVSDITLLIDFMRKQALGYPGYDDWLGRAESEIHCCYKQAILAFSDGRLVGDIVYQPHKTLPRTLELKNLRIHPQLRRRDFGHFILRQVEAEARNSGRYDLILADARANQTDVLELARFSGYQEIARAPLYDSGEEDVMIVRPLNKDSRLISIARVIP